MTDGSLEYIANDNSHGLPVANLDPAGVPAIAAAIWGVTDVEAVDPPRDGTFGEWTCTAQNGSVGTIYYWEVTKSDPIATARALIAASELTL